MGHQTKLLALVLALPVTLVVYQLSSSSSSHSISSVTRILETSFRNGGAQNKTSEDAGVYAAAAASRVTEPPPPAHTDGDDREKVFAARRALVKETCERNKKRLSYGGVNKTPMSMFRWLKKRDMVVCFSAKVGTSTWLRYLLQDGFPNELKKKTLIHNRGIKLLVPENYTSKEAVIRQLMNSTRIANVRHPFTRLLSAYRDKFEPCLTQPSCNGKYLVKEWKSITTFEAFAEYILKRTHVPKVALKYQFTKFDRHWRPYYLNCGVCDIAFDYIVKMETWDEDIRYILGKLGFETEIELHFNNSNSTSVEQDYFKTLPRSTILQLYELYKPDFELFGYKIDKYLH